MSKYKILQTKDKLLLAKCNKIQANNGVQILPGPITSKERVAGRTKLVGCEFINIHQKIYICI